MHSDHRAGRRWAGPGWLLVGLGLLLAACGRVPLEPPQAPLPGPLPIQPASATAARSAEAPVLRIEAGMHTAPIKSIDVDAAERFVVTASDDKTARVWDLASGALLQVLRPPIGAGNEGKLYAVAITPDGSTVATAKWSKPRDDDIYLFERASGRLLRRLIGLPSVVFHLAFSPDGRFLAAALGGGAGIRVYDWHTATEVAHDSDYGDVSSWVEFDRQGRLLTSCDDGWLRLYDAQFRLLAKRQAPGGREPFAARFAPDGSLVAVGFADTTAVNVLDSTDLTLHYAPDTTGVDNGDLPFVAWSCDGQRLYAGGLYAQGGGIFPILQWSQAGRGPVTRLPAATDTVMDLRTLADGRLVFGAADPALGVFDRAGARLWTQGPATVDYRARHAALLVSQDGSVVEFGFDVLQPEQRWRSRSARLHLAEGRLLFDPLPPASGVPLHPPRSTELELQNWQDRRDPTLNGAPLPLQPYEYSYALAIAADGGHFVLGTEWRLRLFEPQGQPLWAVPVPSVTWAVNLSGDGRLVIAAFADGTVRWYRRSDGAELLALFVHPDGQRWVLWTPEGFFQASPGGESLIGYHLNQGPDQEGNFVAVGQLYDLFSRPDLVARRLDDDIEPVLHEALTRIGDVRQVLATGLPPLLALYSPAESTQEALDFTLHFSLTPRNGGVGRVVYRLNGAVVGDPTARPPGLGIPGLRRPFTLQPGRNEVSATVYNDKGSIESPPITAVVHVNKVATPQPTLYVLALGITTYRDHDLNLRYAASDAETMVALLRQQGAPLFTDVQVQTLLDHQATLKDIEATFRQLAARIQPHDVFVLYLAGHGAAVDGEYHFLPWDLVYANRQALHDGSVHQTRFSQWLGLIAAQKSVILLDTCQAGALTLNSASTRAPEQKGAIDKLMRATGRATIAATTAQQLAMEGHEEHGVFTYVLLQGLRGAADQQGNRDGQVSVNELADYVADEVPRLSKAKWGYEQHPMHQIEGQSFPLGVVRP